MPKKVVGFIPNLITLCNLLSGCVAVYMSFHIDDTICGMSGLHWTWLAIAAAAVFDFGDGASARGLHAYSAIGKELDSLSDLVSFGVAPGMMMLNLMLGHSMHAWLCFAALLIPVMGAYRLAKFNVDEDQTTTFKGLPIPANAIFWIGASAWIERYIYPGTGLLVVLVAAVSLLMISNMPMFSLKFKNFGWAENFRRYVLLASTALFVICWGISGLMWAIVLYIFMSAALRKHIDA
ncbi:MAG: CDP-alcohol phosphatidyltransferase family protein [Muribaculaceae bacterium]|nr:CDP-alcohol phosphatidyltransferase family protein [Muribaculaceae bacterium]